MNYYEVEQLRALCLKDDRFKRLVRTKDWLTAYRPGDWPACHVCGDDDPDTLGHICADAEERVAIRQFLGKVVTR